MYLKVYVAHMYTPDGVRFENVLVFDRNLTEIKSYIWLLYPVLFSKL